MVETETDGWTDPATFFAIAIGVLVTAALVLHQRRTSAPVLDLDLFTIRNFTWGNLAGFAFGLAFSAMFLGSILFLTEVWGWSILEAGFGVAPGPAFVALLAPRMGVLAGRAYAAGGVYRLLVLGSEQRYLIDYSPSMILTGIRVACCLPQLSSVVAQALPPNRIGIGGAPLQAVRQFGGTFGVALAIALIGAPAGLDAALAAFDRVWWIIVVGGLATSALALPLRTRAA